MRFTILSALAVVGASLLLAPSTSQAAPQVDCNRDYNQMQVRTGTLATTSSMTYVNVTASQMNFTHNATCFVIEVYGKVKAQAPQVLRLRISLDPAPGRPRGVGNMEDDTPLPEAMDFYTSANTYNGVATKFVFVNPTAG